MKSKNVLLLDVDGVLNAVPVWSTERYAQMPCPWPSGWESFDAEFGGTVYRITYAKDLMEELLDIHESGLAEVRWLTTWGAGANERLAEHFGFPQFHVCGEPEYEDRWWKFPLAQAEAEVHDLVVWADDDLAVVEPALRWAKDQPRVLPLVPDPYEGLTPAHIEQVREFLVVKPAMSATES